MVSEPALDAPHLRQFAGATAGAVGRSECDPYRHDEIAGSAVTSIIVSSIPQGLIAVPLLICPVVPATMSPSASGSCLIGRSCERCRAAGEKNIL